MKTNSRGTLLVVICILVLSVNVFLLLTKDCDKSITGEDYSRLSYNMSQLETITNNQLKSNYVCLDKRLKLLTIDGDSVDIEHVVNNQDKFVIRFNDVGCSSCIEDFTNQIPNLHKLIEKLGDNNVVLFLNTKNPRDLLVFKRQFNLKCGLFALDVGALPLPMESGEDIVTYYYFVINQNYRTTECFVSIKELIERTQLYFDSIVKRFG